MTIMILERVPVRLRGDLSRWMLEPKAGIFLGRMTSRIRDELWAKAVAKSACGACLQAWSASGEQGFQMRTHGEMTRKIVDLEGLSLVAITPS
jgi:CRISPR-associated protein Cas2